MVDRVFYFSLGILPLILLVGAVLYANQAWIATEHRRRIWTAATALLLAAAGFVLWAVRQRIRGWEGFDNRAFDLGFVASLAGLAIGAAALGILAIAGRSSKGIPLCPRCWYDMSAHEGICPECGTRIGDERELVLRKRSMRLASVAVSLQLLAQFLYQYHRADHGGARALVPTTLLIAGAFTMPREMIISGPGFRDFSLTGRLTENKLSDWQRSWLFSRAHAALIAGESAESVRRATALLTRGDFESEISLDAWKRAFGRLLADGGLNQIGAAQLARSYLASRSDSEPSEYLQRPRDRASVAKELEEFVPSLEQELASASPGTDEWDIAVRMLAAAGRHEAAIRAIREAVAFEPGGGNVAAAAVSLAALGRESPEASEALIDLAQSLSVDERFFTMVWSCRVGPESGWLQESFRVLAASGEPNLEVLGAAGLAGSPSTRCEGVGLLIDKMRLWRPSAPVFLTTLQWPVLVSPGDRYTSQLLNEVKRYATEGGEPVRFEALNLLTQIADQVPSRRDEIRAFLVTLFDATDRGLADRARASVESLIEKRRESSVLRIGDK